MTSTTPGSDALAKWLERNEITQIDFGKRIDRSPRMMHYYLVDGVIPPVQVQMRIEQETKGEVKLELWTKQVRAMQKQRA